MCTKAFSPVTNKGILFLFTKSSGPLLAGLPLNCFSFSDHYYKQVNVVALSTKMGQITLIFSWVTSKINFLNQYAGTKPEL